VYQWAIKFNGANSATYQNTRDITIRYIEVDGGCTPTAGTRTSSNSQGTGIETNDGANDIASAFQYQENIIIEHCYFHDIAHEGMYLGKNVYEAGNIKPIRYIKVRYNDMVNCGWEAIQGKKWYGGTAGESGATDNEIHGNVTLNSGWNITHDFDQTGISVLSGIVNIRDNWVEDSGDNGIQAYNDNLQGTGTAPTDSVNDVRIYNNVVVRAGVNGTVVGGKHGITSGANAGAGWIPDVRIYSNTVIGSYANGIRIDTSTATSFAKNNISVDNGGTDVTGAPISLYNTTGSSTGLFIDPVGDYGATNFHLVSAIAAGGSVGDYASDDYDGVTRTTPDRGAYEYS
jgi:hypothetical protein